jgi:hypothetical protein
VTEPHCPTFFKTTFISIIFFLFRIAPLLWKFCQISGTNVIKLFTDAHNKLEFFVPGKPSFIFACKAGAYPSEVHYFRIGPTLLSNIILVWKALSVANTSLQQTFVNYGVKKFYNFGLRGQCYKTFYGRKLRTFVIS